MNLYTQHFKPTEPFSPLITSNPQAQFGTGVDSNGNKYKNWKIKLTPGMSVTIDYGRVVNN